jgi:pheromone shutdown protein TraB
MFEMSIGDRIFIIGTMHIDHDSVTRVQQQIRSIKPNVVMIELDRERYEEMRQREINHVPAASIKSPKSPQSPPEDPIGALNAMFFNKLQGFQLDMGELFGISPGKEMLAAIDAAMGYDIPVAFIDRPIHETFQRLQTIGLDAQGEQEEILQTMNDEPITADKVESIIKDLKDPAVLKQILADFKQDYPQLHKVLIEERNEYMAKRVALYAQKYPTHKVLVVVGGGHVQDMVDIIRPQL